MRNNNSLSLTILSVNTCHDLLAEVQDWKNLLQCSFDVKMESPTWSMSYNSLKVEESFSPRCTLPQHIRNSMWLLGDVQIITRDSAAGAKSQRFTPAMNFFSHFHFHWNINLHLLKSPYPPLQKKKKPNPDLKEEIGLHKILLV